MCVLAPHHRGAEHAEDMEGLKVFRFPYFYPRRYQQLCYEGGILSNLKTSYLARLQLPLLFLALLFNTLHLSKRLNIDMIHAHWIVPAGLVGAIYKKIFKIPLIVTVHAGDVFPLQKRYLKKIARFVLNNCDVCTVNSSATKDAVLAIADIKSKVRIIPMGVSPDVFKTSKSVSMGGSKSDGHLTILTVGRLVEKKGVKYLIKAIPLIKRKIPNVRLVIIGDGPEKEGLEQQVNDLRMNDEVDFVGPVVNEQLPEYYSDADVFVLPSIIDSRGDTEGLGVVLLEAMACGTPVVGSNVGGITDIIEDGVNGSLSKQKSSNDIARVIVELLSKDELRKEYSKNGLKTIEERFSWEIVTEEFAQVYRRVGK